MADENNNEEIVNEIEDIIDGGDEEASVDDDPVDAGDDEVDAGGDDSSDGADSSDGDDNGESSEGDKEYEADKGSEGNDSDDEEEDEDELSAIKKQNALLIERLEGMVRSESSTVTDSTEDSKDGANKAGESTGDEEPDPVVFLDENADVEEILDSREKLNSLLVGVYNKALNDAVEKFSGQSAGIREEILTTLPQTVLAQVNQQAYLKKTADDFMESHENLKPFRKTVGMIANEVAAEHSDWTLEEVLKETAKKAYETLGVKKKVVKQGGDANKDGDDVTFANQKGSRKKVSDRRSSVQREIDELIDF